MVMKAYDAQTNGGQYLEDLATAYWLSDALFTALEMELFSAIEGFGKNGASLPELSQKLKVNEKALNRFLNLLLELGLIEKKQESYVNQPIAQTYLLKESPFYQGDSILWRKNLKDDWKTLKAALTAGGRVNFLPEDISEEELNSRREQYIHAMDNVAKLKNRECAGLLSHLKGTILDVGAGSGAMALAFLERFPETWATLLDIRQILPQTIKMINKTPFKDRVDYQAGNILETDWSLTKKYDLIILSNIVHAYAEAENEQVLKTAASYLADDGILLIHDFFCEHDPIKAQLSDLNMFLNTFNGKVFSGKWVIAELLKNQLATTPLIPLTTDTAVIFAACSPEALTANGLPLNSDHSL
jgi:2-polyprenyl-3-methyl-5-hydroxy-6-metoxy-1,4-benzoquinol methylase